MDSRLVRDMTTIRRRRGCMSCGRRFTTYEKIEEQAPMLIKRDGRREAYSREKLSKGIFVATQKRPVPVADIEAFIESLERHLQETGLNEIHTTEIGERVADFLKRVDPVAYVRFASVYRQFTSLDDFDREIRGLDFCSGSVIDDGKCGQLKQ
jgi:transcriptional repressor NrdR